MSFGLNMSVPISAICYVVSRYPAYSHGFIESEIAAVRRTGTRVLIFSINRPEIQGHSDLATTVTFYGGSLLRRVRAILGAVLMRPLAVIALLQYQRIIRLEKARPRRFDALRDVVYVAQALYLEEVLAAHEISHLHVHFANNSADVARLAVYWHREKVVGPSGRWIWSLAVHGPTDFDLKDSIGLASKVFDADFVTCISNYCRTEVARIANLADQGKLQIVRMGADPPEQPATPPTHIRTRPLLLFVGRLVAKKGLADLLLALRDWPGPAIDLLIVGDGPDRVVFQECASNVSLRVSVEFCGAKTHPETLNLIGQADIVCLPSYSEGLPVVLMEALVRETAVLTTAVAGIPELVTNGECGVIVTPGEIDEIQSGLLRLVCDEELRREFGRRGRDVVEQFYNPDNNARELIGLHAQAANGVV